jgi:hypothetical protein
VGLFQHGRFEKLIGISRMSKEKYQLWLSEIPDDPVMLACGLLFANRKSVSRSFSEEYPTDLLEKAYSHLAEASKSLALHQSSGTRMTWSFENAQLHFMPGPAGIHFAVVTLSQQKAALALVDRLMEEFKQLANKGGLK